jgi:general secretion pathway protein D
MDLLMQFPRLILLVFLTGLCACKILPSPSPSPSLGNKQLLQEIADWQSITPMPAPMAQQGNPPSPFTEKSPVLHEARFTIQLIDMPVEAVLQLLANDAALILQLNQAIPGNVSVSARELTLSNVLTQIALQVSMYWRIEDGVLHVWGDQPYTQSYAIDYLNLDRSTRSRVGLATQVGTINASTENSGSSIANSSETLLENAADHHFWQSVAIDLDGLVNRNRLLDNASYTLNRDVGLITLHASAHMHSVLQDYLQKLNESAKRQVLIEATVVEVALSDSYNAGIDWQLLSSKLNGVSAAQVFSGSPTVTADTVDRIPPANGLLSIVQKSSAGAISATLNLLQQFGDVHILSKPRIIALNNQSSVLKVVDNRVYFTVNVERQRSETKDEIITESQIHTVPVGLVMNVTPFIDKHGDVMLNVRPTLSRILGFVDDPNPELALANVRNSVPEIQVREMESMLRVQSGQMAIIGGLMQDTLEQNNNTLPGLASVPGLGWAFRQSSKQRKQTELLIVLKPTVLLGDANTNAEG